MRKLGIVGFSVLATLFIGCGKSDGPSTGVSEQVAAQQCYTDENFRVANAGGLCLGVGSVNTAPQLCYSDANYRAQNANGLCASVPNNLPAQCYTDTNYRINNMNGLCAGTNSNTYNGTGTNYQSPWGTTTNNGVYNNGGTSCGIQGGCLGSSTVFHQAPANCGSCGNEQEFVVDIYSGQGRCYDLPRRQVTHSAYIGFNYNKVSGLGSTRQLEFGYSGSLFIPGKRSNAAPVNSCQGNDARVACNLHTGNSDCSQILGANNAVCIPEGSGSFGFCGVIDAQGW